MGKTPKLNPTASSAGLAGYSGTNAGNGQITPESILNMVGTDQGVTPIIPEEEPETETEKDSDLMAVLKSISGGLQALSQEVSNIKKEVNHMKTGGAMQFKDAAKKEDIQAASSSRQKVDPKINQMVDEMLGEDFGVEMKTLGDRPGFRFTLIVPSRLSDNVRDRRPKAELNEHGLPTGQYMKDAAGTTIFEDYIPEDRRSRMIASTDSYDAIKQHCERVRSHIVATFQKLNQPLPEFKVK